jgi:hypothetical protein
VKRSLLFVAASAALIAAAWVIGVLLFAEAAVRQSLTVAACTALGVQVVAFLIARGMARKNVMAGWGLGVLVRFLALAIFALLVVPRLGLPLGSSLIGLATFLFLTTLIEPLFLKT